MLCAGMVSWSAGVCWGMVGFPVVIASMVMQALYLPAPPLLQYPKGQGAQGDGPHLPQLLLRPLTSSTSHPFPSSLQYPKEDKERKVLVYFCRSCRYQEDADPSEWCVYRNEVHHTSREKSVVLQVGVGRVGERGGPLGRQ